MLAAIQRRFKVGSLAAYHSAVIGQALWQALSEAGVPEPHKKLVYTGIPLRENQR